jgi:phage gp36-like protein
MANFLTAGELKSHIYEEIANEITRNDDSIIDDAIDTAIDEIKGYLTKYDLVACIDTVLPANRNKKLLSVAKDLATWYLIHLCNVNIDYEKRRDLYDNAVMWLSGVQKGKIVPELPVATIAGTNPAQPTNPIKWQSNPKRNNHI